MARLNDEQREHILADYHIGKSQNELAKKYEVSPATINKLCKGVIPRHVEKVNELTRIKTELSEESEYQVNAIHKEVDERTKHIQFFNAASYKVTKSALAKIEADPDLGMADLRHASEIVSKQREGILGKMPDTAIQINNQQSFTMIETVVVAHKAVNDDIEG